MSSSDDGPGLLGLLGVLGGMVVVSKMCDCKEKERERVRRLEEEEEERKEERRRQKQEKIEAKRRNSQCLFMDGISEQEFQQIVADARKHMKRVQLRSCGPIVHGTVRAQSGLSTWDFTLDFNDFGHITGKHWDLTENTDSSYPDVIADRIQSAIHERLTPQAESSQKWMHDDQDDSDVIDDSEEDEYIEAQTVESHPVKKKKRGRLRRWICVLLVLALLCTAGLYLLRTYTPIGISSSSLRGMYYKEVIEKLHTAGFDSIKLKELEDLNVQQRSRLGEVSEVIIGEDKNFTQDFRYLRFTSVVVVYHSLKDIPPSCTSKEAKKMLYPDLIELLQKDGFTNIRTEKLPDLINGWITKENSVAEISIAGGTKFDKESLFDPDSEIVITYHTFDEEQ